MVKRFIKLTKLSDLWKDDERWQANVRGEGLSEGYTLSAAEDDESVEAVEQDFDENEMEATIEVEVYDFMGSANEQERFYPRDDLVYRHKTRGTFWLEWRENIEAF